MTNANEERLGRMFLDWVKRLPLEEVVRRYRALESSDRVDVEGYAFEESAAALNSDEPYGDRLEALARCFDAFADAAKDAPPLLSSESLFRERAHELRHPAEWREEQRAAADRSQLSDRLLQAMALASSCVTDEPSAVRLRRIEEVLPKLNQLADEAVAEGDFNDESVIGENIVMLRRLRADLQAGL